MIREQYRKQLQKLHDDVLILGSLVESAIIESVELLKKRDLAGAQRLIDADRRINERRFAIENDALTLIATQQPMASDMRTLAAVLEIVTELERIGDYAKGIANISIMIGEKPLLKPLVDIPQMAKKARDMLHESLDAFVNQNVALARSIPPKDDEVDNLYNQVYRELITYIMADPTTIDQATHLLWVAHNLERTADRVLNICERVIFTATGDMVELNGRGRLE